MYRKCNSGVACFAYWCSDDWNIWFVRDRLFLHSKRHVYEFRRIFTTQHGHNWKLFSLLSSGNVRRLASLKTGMNAMMARKSQKTEQCRAICKHAAILRGESGQRHVITLIVSRSVDREACISACRAPAVIRSIEAPVAGNTQLQAF